VAYSVGVLNPIVEVGTVTEKNATFEVPPPGLWFTTVTEVVLALAMSEAGTLPSIARC